MSPYSYRSRSRTPELSPRSSPLAPIPELPRQERASEPHAARNTLSLPRQLRYVTLYVLLETDILHFFLSPPFYYF